LTWIHCSFSRREQVSLESLSDGAISADLFAKAALANKMAEPLWKTHRNPDVSLAVDDEKILRSTIQAAKNRFRHLWKKSHAAVKSMERLGVITLLVSFLVFGYALSLVLRGDFISEGTVSVASLMVVNIAARVVSLVLGLVVSTALYVLSSCFEGILVRRRTNWEYFIAGVDEKLSTE
jgi:hypothetical protein